MMEMKTKAMGISTLIFFEIMDKALSESELQKDCSSASGSEAPSVKLLIPLQDPVHVEIKSPTPAQDRLILVD